MLYLVEVLCMHQFMFWHQSMFSLEYCLPFSLYSFRYENVGRVYVQKAGNGASEVT